MSNSNMQSPEDEWIINPNFPDIRIQVDYDNKIWKGAEEDGKYVRRENFTDRICEAIEDLMKKNPIPFAHFLPPKRKSGRIGMEPTVETVVKGLISQGYKELGGSIDFRILTSPTGIGIKVFYDDYDNPNHIIIRESA